MEYAGLASSSVNTGVQRRPHSSASARQSSSSSGASDGDTAVTARARSPSTSLATYASSAESAPPLNATTTSSSDRSSSRRRSRRSAIDDLDADALVALALRLRLHDADATDLVGARHVRAAVRLLVEADDVDDADLLHRLGDHVDLRADQVLVLDGGLARQEHDLDRSTSRELLVDASLDRLGEALGERVELEVHASRQRLHVPTGDRCLVLVPDDAAQHVQRGVRAHELVPPLPVDLAVNRRAGAGHVALEDVHDLAGVAVLAHVGDLGGAAVPRERARVVRLAPTGHVEGGLIEHDAAVDHPGDDPVERPKLGVAE